MFLWGFFRSLDGGEAVIDARRLLSAQRFFLRWESRSALPCLHAHCPCALRGVWVVTVRPSSCLSSDRSPAVCRSSVECTAAFCDCTTRQQDMSSPFSPACMALLPLPAPCLVAVSVFVQLHHCCCLTGPVAVRSLFCAHVFSSPCTCKYPHPGALRGASGALRGASGALRHRHHHHHHRRRRVPQSAPPARPLLLRPHKKNKTSLVSMPQASFQLNADG